MASGLQDIPLRRIPEVWDRQWFADFVRDVLRLADSRNIKVSSEFDLTGQSDEVATLSMGLGTIDLNKLADQPGLSVIGNPAVAAGVLSALVASADLQVLRRSGSAVGFGLIDATYISDFEEAAQDAVGAILTDSASVNFTYDDALETIIAAVLPAGVDHNSLANLTVGDPHTQYAAIAQAEAITGAWNFTTRQQVFGTTTANLALVSGLPDTGVSIQCVEQIRTHRIAAEPYFELIRLNTSYAAPSALVSGNSAGGVTWGGYDGTTIQGQTALIFLDITETWSGSARGGNLRFQTTTTGATSKTDRLVLGANSTGDFARFPSGVVTQAGLGFLVDTDNGLYYIGTNNWACAAGGSKIIDIATTGIAVTGALSATGTVTVPNTSFTYAKLQDVSATSRVLGRITAGSGVIEELTGANLATIIGTALGANPSASIGLAAVNGTAGTYMRSDGAPALSQSIAPTWTAAHTFTLAGTLAAPTILLSSTQPVQIWSETDQPTDEKNWAIASVAKAFQIRSSTDSGGASITWFSATRGTGTAISNISIGDNTNNNSYTYPSTGTSTFSGAISTTRIVATGSTVATNGMYLPVANNPALAANSTKVIDWTTTLVTLAANLSLGTAGNKILIKEGTNASMGVATLVLGTVVVNTTVVSATSRIQLTAQSLGTVTVPSALAVSARTAGTSFTILASALTDTSVVAWQITEPA